MHYLSFLFFTFFMSVSTGLVSHSSIATDPEVKPIIQATNLLFQSSDGGTSWEDISQGLPFKLPITSVFIKDGQLVLGTDNSGVYIAKKAKQNLWKREDVGDIFPFGSGFFPNDRILGIFPSNSGIYVSVYNNGFFRKIPDTPLWQSMNRALEEKTILSVLENPDGSILVSTINGIYKSSDDGKSWHQVFKKGIVMNLIASQGILIGSSSQCILCSTDGGDSWNCTLSDEKSLYSPSMIMGRLTALCIGGPRGSATKENRLCTTEDGITWKPMSLNFSKAEDMYQLEQVGDVLFCSHKAGISRSSDGGKTWELVQTFPSEDKLMRYQLVSSGQTIYAILIWAAGC